MARILFAQSIGTKSVALVASTLLHGALALAAANGAHGHERGAPAQPFEVEVETLPEVVTHPPVDDDDDDDHHHAHAFGTPAHHTHPYPVSPDHDAHPHDPRIDHRLAAAPAPGEGSSDALPAAPRPAIAAEDAPVHFSMTIGNNTGATGVVGGAAQGPGGSGPAVAAAGDRDEVVPESRVSVPSRPLVKIAPPFPAAAQAAGVEADVPLEIVVGTDGRVLEARVLRPAGFGFDEASRRAALASRFSPAERDGKRVRVRMHWTMQFHFQK